MRLLEHLRHGAVLGLAFAAMVEHAAQTAGRWSYTERMPVSVLGAGLWPLLQMALLSPHVLVCQVVGRS